MRETFAAVTSRTLEDDPRLVVVLADISAALFADAARRNPDRVLNLGIREQLMVSVAGGLALEGLRPILHSYAPFLVERPFEQVKLDLGHQDAGAVLVSVGASYDWPEGGRTHQAPEDVSLLDSLDGWHVYVPGHADEAETLLRHAFGGSGRDYVRLSARNNATAHPVVPGEFLVVRRGSRGTVVAVGPMLDPALAATDGLDVTVLYATTLRPFDTAALVGTLSVPDVVLVEPALAGTSARQVADALRHVPHRQLGLGVGRTELRAYGTPADHDRLHGLDPDSLRRDISAFLSHVDA